MGSFVDRVGYCIIILSRPALGHAHLPLYFVVRSLYPTTKWTVLESDQFLLPRDELKIMNNYYPCPVYIHCLVNFYNPRQVLHLAEISPFKLFK
jgi:hypothetical protein